MITQLGKAAALRRVISIVGGGGKTTLIFWLKEYLRGCQKSVIITTTTHMLPKPGVPLARLEDRDKIAENIGEFGYTMVGEVDSCTGKLGNKNPMNVRDLLTLADVVLIEADGAKHRPLKVPAEYEPVILPETDMVIAVVGMDCLGEPIIKVCHRPKTAACFLGKSLEEVILREDIAAICSSESGYRKGVEGREYHIFLNKTDFFYQEVEARKLQTLLTEQQDPGRCRLSRGQIHYGALQSINTHGIALIILAAGNSRRFGAENKLLHQVEGKPMYRWVLDRALRLPISQIVVVTQYEEIGEYARFRGMSVMYNQHPGEGISYSIRLGVRAAAEAEGWMFAVCDQPYLTRKTMEELLALYGRSKKKIAAVSRDKKLGNPCIFSRDYQEELLQLKGDTGGKHIVVNHREDTEILEVKDERELEDIDCLAEAALLETNGKILF